MYIFLLYLLDAKKPIGRSYLTIYLYVRVERYRWLQRLIDNIGSRLLGDQHFLFNRIYTSARYEGETTRLRTRISFKVFKNLRFRIIFLKVNK